MVPDGRAEALERLLLERLERVASEPAVVLRRALELANLATVPADPVELGMFCRGPLDEALTHALGPEIAEAIVEELAGLAVGLPTSAPNDAVKSSGTRPRKRKEGSGTRKRRDAFVVMASRDDKRTAAFLRALDGRAPFAVAADVFTLMQAVEANLDRELVLVFDGSVPGLRGPMLMTLVRILPPSAAVVFWGAPPPNGSVEIEATALPPEATAAEVAGLCVGDAADEDDADLPVDVILLADDDPVWLATLERRFRHEGYAVIAVEDGFAALEAAIDHRPALVVTDFDMPTLDGQQLAALIVGRFGEDAPPIVMLTASEIGPAPGVDRVMDKSASFEEILAEVRSHLGDPADASRERRIV